MQARVSFLLTALAWVALAAYTTPPASAQIPVLPNQAAYVDFNSLGTGPGAVLPVGVRAAVYPEARAMGTFAGAQQALPYRAGRWMPPDAPAGLYNFGSGDSTSAQDRAPGFLLGNDGVRTAVLYIQFVNQTGAPLQHVSRLRKFETYRNGYGVNPTATQSRLVQFVSRDGVEFIPVGDVAIYRTDSTGTGFEDAPVPDSYGASVRNLFEQPVPNGAVFYLAYQYSVATGDDVSGTAAVALDDIAIAPSSFEHLFMVPDRMERVFPEREVGAPRDSMWLRLNWYRFPPSAQTSGPDVDVEVTGPAALDFEVREVGNGSLSIFYHVFFSPTAPGPRSAVATFSTPGVLSQRVILEGSGVAPNSAEETARPVSLRLEGPYPNPATATARLVLTPAHAGSFSLRVTDVLGRVVARQDTGPLVGRQAHPLQVDLRGLSAGVYQIRADGETGSAMCSVAVVP